jgi:hypothetical protein
VLAVPAVFEPYEPALVAPELVVAPVVAEVSLP